MNHLIVLAQFMYVMVVLLPLKLKKKEKLMKKTLISNLVFAFILSISVSADDHMESTSSFPGLISSEIFDLDGKMDLHIERRKTCNQNAVAKHFHPASFLYCSWLAK